MNETLLFCLSLVILLAISLLIFKLMTSDDKATKVLCADVLSIQCLGVTILLGIYGLGDIALQFGFVLALLGFISTIILSTFIRS